MTKKILAFGASSSKESINKKFATFVANQIENAEIQLLDLNDFEMPIYSIDKENSNGIPTEALDFKKEIKNCDGIIISFAEHNGGYTAAYKNIYDWMSRIEKSVWEDKPMLLLATSPGGRGAKGVLEIVFNSYSRSNKNVVGKFSLPSFSKNFNEADGILDDELKKELSILLQNFEKSF